MRSRAVAENRGIAEDQRVSRDAAVLLAIALDLQAKVRAHGLERPTDVMAVEMSGDAIEILLAKNALGMNQLVAGQAARGHQHDEDAAVRHEQESDVLDDAARERRRNEDSQAARNRSEDVARALHHRLGRLRGFEFAANPLAVFGAGGGLRRDLLDEKPIGRRRRDAPSGSVRLVEIPFTLEIGHHAANCRGTQRLDVAVRNASRRHRLARLDIFADHVGEDLLVPLLL